MASEKEFPLSITLRTVDRATSGIRRVNDQLEKTFGPLKRLSKEFGSLHENMGLSKISAGFSGIAGQVKSLAAGVGLIAGAGAAAVFGLKGLIDEFDDMGDKAEALGIGVAELVQLRYAAERSGAEVGALDSSLQGFNKNLGMAKAGTGRFTAFLKKVSPPLLKQIKGSKTSEEAFGLLADAMSKVSDQGKKTALAMAAGFDPSLIPLLSRGAAGVKELREQVKATSEAQAEAARLAGPLDDAWKQFGATLDGLKGAIVIGLGPAFGQLTKRATEFLTSHQAEIAAWLTDFGEKLPGRISALGEVLYGIWTDVLKPLIDGISSLVEKLGGAADAVDDLVTAFVIFQGIKLIGSLASIAQGLVGVASAASAAGAAMSGVGGAGAAVGGAALKGLGLAAAGGAVVAAGAAGAAVGAGADFLTGKLSASGRSLSDRFSGTGGEQLLGGRLLRLSQMSAGGRQTLGAAQVASQGFAASKPAEAKITVDFTNTPKGTRVNTEPRSTAHVETNVGNQMGFGP